MARSIWNGRGPLLDAVERRRSWQAKAHEFVGETDACGLCGLAAVVAVHRTGPRFDTTEDMIGLQVEALFDSSKSASTEWEANAADALSIELARMRHPSQVAERRELLDAWEADEVQRVSDAGVDYVAEWTRDDTDLLADAGYFVDDGQVAAAERAYENWLGRS